MIIFDAPARTEKLFNNNLCSFVQPAHFTFSYIQLLVINSNEKSILPVAARHRLVIKIA